MSPSQVKKPFEAYRGEAPYVFVSYAHDDDEVVYAELLRLRNLGFNVWYDEGVSPGSRWSDELARRISNCALFLFYVTPRSIASPNCQDEANFRLDTGKPFLAVHLEETELPPGLQLRMGSRQAILGYQLEPSSYERKLQTAINAHVPTVAAQDSGPGQEIRPQPVSRRVGRKPAFLALGLLALVFAYFTLDRIVIYPSQGVGFESDRSDIQPAAQRPSLAGRPRPLTSMEGYELWPALSPDGNFVAFASQALGESIANIFVKEVGGGNPIKLTDAQNYDKAPTWSPDGTRIAFIREDTQSGRHDIIVKPILGGFETILMTTHRRIGNLDWSADGELIAFQEESEQGERRHLLILSLANGAVRTFTEEDPVNSDRQPKFSPDGRGLAFIRSASVGDDICIQDLHQTETRCITPEDEEWIIGDIDWTPASDAVVASVAGTAGSRLLMRIPLQGGVPISLPFGEDVEFLSIARAGSRLVYERYFLDHDIWRLPGPNAADTAVPENLIASTRDELAPTYSPNGEQVAFISNRTGALELWVADADGSDPRQLTNWGFAGLPNWSPDSQQILFSTGKYLAGTTSQGDPNFGFNKVEIFAVDSSGGIPRMLTQDDHEANFGSYSADGQWLYFLSREEECGYNVWKRRLATGEELELTRCGFRPLEGPEGRVYFINVDDRSIMSVSADGENLRTEIGVNCRMYDLGWQFWNNNLVYADCEDKLIKMLDLDTREITVIGDVSKNDSGTMDVSLDISPDGHWIIYNRLVRAGSDLMLVEPFE